MILGAQPVAPVCEDFVGLARPVGRMRRGGVTDGSCGNNLFVPVSDLRAR
jgi:hypothetical protein